jgi:hypothetical protein
VSCFTTEKPTPSATALVLGLEEISLGFHTRFPAPPRRALASPPLDIQSASEPSSFVKGNALGELVGLIGGRCIYLVGE